DVNESGATDDCGNHQVRLAPSGLNQGFLPRCRPAVGADEQFGQVGVAALVRDHSERSAGPADNVGQCLDVGRSSHGRYGKALRRALDEVERRLADRAGRPEDGYLAGHVSPNSWAAAVSTATGTRPSSRSS